jgi:hydroxymethylpyrimidine/phosphomethylpyrimidine kinase
MSSSLISALSIAGSDPTGGAGLQSDLQVFRSLGLHGAGVVTALTIQDSSKVHQVLPAFPSVVLDQLRVLLRDFQPAAVKIGMLASDDVARNVALGLADLRRTVPVVVDPVLHSSDGAQLLERRAWGTLKELFNGATLVTPNLPEAEALCELDVSSRSGTESAARMLIEELGARAALVKGGHREGTADDLLALRGPGDAGSLELHWLERERIEVGPVHGTGCALSSAIAARLALGDSILEAVRAGRAFVARALRRSAAPGRGTRFLVYP